MEEYRLKTGERITSMNGLKFRRDGKEVEYEGDRTYCALPGKGNLVRTTAQNIYVIEQGDDILVRIVPIE